MFITVFNFEDEFVLKCCLFIPWKINHLYLNKWYQPPFNLNHNWGTWNLKYCDNVIQVYNIRNSLTWEHSTSSVVHSLYPPVLTQGLVNKSFTPAQTANYCKKVWMRGRNRWERYRGRILIEKTFSENSICRKLVYFAKVHRSTWSI